MLPRLNADKSCLILPVPLGTPVFVIIYGTQLDKPYAMLVEYDYSHLCKHVFLTRAEAESKESIKLDRESKGGPIV